MKPLSTLSVIIPLALGAVSAQETLPKLSAEELAARRQSVVNLETHIAQREERLGAIVTDIRALDDRVEKGVDEIVTMTSQVKDSETSRRRVAQTKADVIVGLKRTIDYYNTHRDTLREQLRTGKSALPKETLEKDLAIFDARVEKRVKQVMELAKSFPDPQELAKYETTLSAGWDGLYYANEEISEAWKQNRRDTRHTESAREGVSQGLRDSIDHLKQRNSYLADKLKGTNLSEAERAYYESEISHNTALIGQRNQQLEEFATGSATPAAPMEPNAAHDLDLVVQSARKDLREDFFAIFRKYAELNRARAEVKALQDNLAARKEWLAKYDAAQPR